MSPAVVLDAMPALAQSDIPQIATALMGEVGWMREHLANDTTRPVLDAYGASLYAPRLATLGLHRRAGDTDATIRLRGATVYFLAFTVRNASVRAQLNTEGRKALGLDGDGKVDLSRVDADLRRAALRVTVQESGEAAYNAVLGELKTNHNTQQRYELLSALGSTHYPKLGAQARDYALTPAVAVGELDSVYGSNVSERENREAFWQWFQSHFDALRTRVPDSHQAGLTHYAAGNYRCSKAQSDELRSWFAPRIQSVIGGERALAQVLEGIDQCTALREHVGEKALATWAEAHPAH